MSKTLGVKKFYDDMEKCFRRPSKYFLAYGLGSSCDRLHIDSYHASLPRNTLVDYATGLPSEDTARRLAAVILGVKEGASCPKAEILGQKHGWTFKNIEDICRKGFFDTQNVPNVETPRA